MFLFENDFRASTKTIRGVRCIAVSFYSGDKDIFDKVGTLIKNDFSTTKTDEITNDSSVNNGIAIAQRFRYCVSRRRRFLWQQKRRQFTAGSARTKAASGSPGVSRRKMLFVKDNFTEVEESNNHQSAVVALWYIPRFTFVFLRVPPLGQKFEKELGIAY